MNREKNTGHAAITQTEPVNIEAILADCRLKDCNAEENRRYLFA
jgi:hypothetical protein